MGLRKRRETRCLSPQPHTRELELKIWESRGGRKTPRAEAVEKIKEIKATMEANKGIPKKIEQSPIALVAQKTQQLPHVQDEVEDEDQAFVTITIYKAG